ncbi:SIS domain-containing protein [Dyadobacter sediminis]|uniref:SIS domain-containing protein n=1 Tax=Dyadobacter sediminis TaxID=1493691 RepID=A0A5R9KBE7_9BACT|nr:SIS domain-containing protein [Dyadobacter sediminis]TLU92141.1 SIS domain-containing protein [Dyadobacter sediminis]GGB97078.1 putative tagatose-6-phosphate ketose/aldose isomerase [Dyadobacter sediminis]
MQKNQVSEFTSGGEAHTQREILSQPELWQEVFHLIRQESEGIAGFLRPVLQKGNLRVLLTGAGTSGFIGDAAQGTLQKIWQRPVQAVPTTEIVTQPETVFIRSVPTLLISFARSGNSPESVETVRLANASCDEIYHLIITCNGEGALANMNATAPSHLYQIVLPEATNDKSLAMTSSFTCMLLSVLLVAHLDSIESELERVLRIVEQGNTILEEKSLLEALVIKGFERVVFIGSGEFLGIARECHLKLLELTDGKQVCMSDSFLGFRHGPRAFVNEHTLMVYLFSRKPHILRYERDLAEDISRDAREIQSLQIGGIHEVALPHSSKITLSIDPENPYQVIPAALVGQLLGYYSAVHLGINPDSPSVSGSISRVVQGVNIYTEYNS